MELRRSKDQGVSLTEVGILRFRRRITATAAIGLSYDEVLRAAGTCLPLLLSESLRSRPGSVRAKVGWRSWLPAVTVEPEVSSARRSRSGAAGHIHWHAARYRGLFPELEADVFVRPLGQGRSRLVVDSTYRPPGGLPGIVGDLLVGRLAARSTLATFTARLTRAIQDAVAANRCGPALGAQSRDEVAV